MSIKHGEGFSLQDYLKAIAKLEASANPVTVTAVARVLAVKKPSVTQMLRRLNDGGLVAWSPRNDITLTKRGRLLSNGIIRNHRILESFFYKLLKLDLLEAHLEAEKLEHVVSQSVIEKMYAYCGEPTVDPHGQRIPPLESSDLSHLRQPQSYVLLLDLELGAEAKVVEFIDSNEENLKSIVSHNLKLWDNLKRLSQVEFLLNGKKLKLHRNCLESVWVQRVGN